MLSRFKNLRIATKIFAAIAVLMATAVAMSAVALLSFAAMTRDAEELTASGVRLQASGRAMANLLSYARAIEFLPIEMPVAERDAFEKAAVDEYRRLNARLDQLERTARTETGRADVAKVRAGLARYAAQAEKIQRISRSGDYDAAGKIAYEGAAIIGEARHVLRALDERSESRQSAAAASAEKTAATAQWQLLFTLAIGGLISLTLVGYIVIVLVTRPLQGITGAMLKVAAGDTEVPVPSLGRKDEVGELAGALETFKANLVESRRLAAEQDREREAKERRANVVAAAVAEFERSVGEVVNTVSSASNELEAAATSLTKTADSTQQMASFVAAASEQASGNVQSVAAATDEMTSSVGEIGRQVQESSRRTHEAVRQAKSTDAQVSQLLDAAGRIGDVVKLITAVAEQTNLLALNATIEAARAGEAGKGFAVVASEVKQLAGQTAKATEAISSQIAAMQTATREAASSIQEIGRTILEVSEIATAIAAAVEEQGAATGEIARNVQEAAKGTAQVTVNITEVNQGAVDTGSASSQVLSAARELSTQGSVLKAEVDRFLASVRAA